MAFYNTIYYTGDELKKAQEDAKKQEELIAAIFKFNPYKDMTPSEMWDFLKANCGFKGPITSVRRAMTVLSSKDGGYVLKMLDKRKQGIYGKPEHYWILNTPSSNGQTSLF